MSFSNHGRFRQQVRFLRRQFLQDGDLPFTDVLSGETVAQALAALNLVWLDRIYSPLVTLWVFLGQVLSQDHSCRAAVARLIAHRVSQGQRPCSAETGAYCQARKRLPEGFFAEVARKAGQSLDNSAKKEWLWKRRRVLAYDGSTVSMPDTSENQQAYPQPPQQQPGLGFPLARMAAFFSLSCGAVLDLAICSNYGKGHSELGMLRQLWDLLRPDDVVLADRYMCAWHEIYLLKQRGIDTVTRLHHCRRIDFRRGKRLGKDDHIVQWSKPGGIRSVDLPTFRSLPQRLTIRETRVRVEQPGFRCRSMIVVSTLLDAQAVTASDLADLYRARWNAELDLRSLKQTMQMDILRCKTPELVRKEIWTHILAYNLIRTIIAQAASQHHIEPRTISFKGAIQTLEAFQPQIATQGDLAESHRRNLKPRKDAVRMEQWITNGSSEPLAGLNVQNCVMFKGAPEFAAADNDNKIFSKPYAACRANEADRWVITAWTPCDRVWGNPPCPCMHSDPKFPDCKPGETSRLRGWLSFYEGKDIDAELRRIEATGWQNGE